MPKRLTRSAVQLLCVVAVAAWSRPALAQTPTLEFFTGANNPTGNGPVTTSQVITFQNNTDNPTGTTLAAYSPTTTVTFALSNQQYTNGANAGVMFGASTTADNSTTPGANALFPVINSISGNNNVDALYTATSGVSGGIAVATNRSVELGTDVRYLGSVKANTRYYYGDLTITFSQPTVNPVLHLTGLGSITGGLSFTTELDLDPSVTGVTLSKLSGSTELNVPATQILNNATTPTTATGTTTTASGAASGSVLATTPAAGVTSLKFKLYLRAGNADASAGTTAFTDGWLLGVSKLTPTVLTGYVFEDVNYGGGRGRGRGASGAAVRSGATVELYDNAGNFAAYTTTDANGQYTFNVPAGTYKVRVVNSTVTSSRPGAVASLLPVQTYNGTTTRVGGENPAYTDAGANTGSVANATTSQTLAALSSGTVTPESIAAVTVGASTASTTGPNFGFNFDLIVNANNAGQGSLRQFIVNSNTLTNNGLDQAAASSGGTDPAAGVETSLFMIPDGQAHPGLLAASNGGPAADPNFTSQTVGGTTQRFVSIVPTAVLPTITDASTTIDGTTQTQNIGDTNTTTLGTGGTVGTAGTTLAQLSGPEIQLSASRGFDGLTLNANNVTVRGLSLYGFNNDITTSNDITGCLIELNVLGTSATSFTDPGANVRSANEGIEFTGSDNSTVRNNLMGFHGGMGIWVLSGTNNSGANTNTISGNEIRGNALEVDANGEGKVFDGMELQGGSTGNTVSGNLITANSGHGIDSFNNTVGGNTISGNTISNNGQGIVRGNGLEGSGLRVYGATNTTTITGNVLSGNNGSGVLVEASAGNVTISQNSTFGNTRLGIDLLSTADGNTAATTYNGATGTATNVSLNDNGDGDAGGNGVLNYPIITSATVIGTNLVVQGYARPSSIIELFAASSTANSVATNAGFGQGQTYLGTFTEGSSADTNSGTGTYSGTINGLAQGTDNTNQFTLTIPLTGKFASVTAGTTVLTSTATLSSSTSEFSGNAPVYGRPAANNDFTTTTAGTAVTFAVTSNDTPTASLDNTTIDLDPNTAGIQTSYTITGQGTFTTAGAPAGQVIFTPANNTFTGTATIPYVVSNTSGVLSNQANLSVYVSPGLDLATTVTTSPASGPITGNSAVTYTVTDTNNSAFSASNVTATLQLPAGLTSNGGTVGITSSSNGSGTYDNTTGIVTFASTTLAAGASATYSVAVSKVPTTDAIRATSTVASTGNGQEANTANNTATSTLAITPAYDVSTTLTGPVDASGNAVSVVKGDLVTYAVLTSNAASAISAAPSVVQTVSFDGDLTAAGLYISNGGTAAYNASTKKTVVTFPTLATLAAGQSVPNTISFAAPSSGYNATATVTANSDNTGDTSTSNNATATLATTVKSATGGAVNVATTVSTDKTQASPGDAVTLTLTATNNGPAAATTVVPQLQLPAGLSSVTFPNSNGSYNATTGLVTFSTLASLASGSSNPTAFKVQFAAPATGVVLATATVSEDNADTAPADNVAEVKVNVNSLTDLTTEIEGPATAAVGQAVTYAAVTSNLSQTTATGVVERVQLPPNLGPSTVTFSGPATGSYDNATGVVTFTFSGGVAAGSRLTNLVSFTMPASTITDPTGATTGSNILAVGANVRTSTPESNAANNAAQVQTTVTPTADVRVSLSGPSTALVGGPATYVVTTTNDGAATAASVVPTLQLPSGLTSNGGTVTITGGGSYSNTTGLVTFPTLTNLGNGYSASSTVTVTMPDVAELTPVAQVQVGATTIDRDLSNNRAQVTTQPAAATATTADLSATISITTGSTTPAPNAAITLTASFANASGGAAASQVVPSLALPAGLTANGPVTVGGGGSYDNSTGFVTWPSVATLAAGATLPGTYTVSFVAPSSGSVTGTAYVASSTSDAAPANNTAATTLTVTSQTDVTTSISGPSSNTPVLPGSRVTYTVVTTNAGPSPATNDVTQTVTLPSGVDMNAVSYPVGSAVNGSVITFPAVKALGVGSAVNYVSFNAPTTNYSVTGAVSMTGDANTNNNNTTANTTVNRAPVAYNVVNTLQSPEGSTAGAQLISPLVATDADASSTLSYRLTALPSAAVGVLTLNGTAITTNTVLAAADINNLSFNPVGTISSSDPAYVGNAFFSYIAIDNLGAMSAPALYTIAVGQDNASTYTQVAYGPKVYQNGDVVANVLDTNAARYSSSGQVYSTTDGTLVATNGTVSNGVASAAAATSADATTLANNGLALNTTTGQVTVADRTKLKSGAVTFNVTTVDANGGTNTAPVTLTFSYPLPVTLVSFTAQAVQLQAVLRWETASELNSSYFAVERSFDGQAFAPIGRLQGQGSKAAATTYAFTDASSGQRATGPVYYRLQQVDLDGTSTYSAVRSVAFGAVAPAISLYPNPATTTTTLDLTLLPAGTYQVSVLDATGRVLLRQAVAAGLVQQLALADLAAGSYTVLVSNASVHLTTRLVKE